MRRLVRRITPRSLRVRIMVTLVGLVVTLGVVALVNAASDMVDLLEDELEQRGIAIARDVAARSAGPALTNDVFALYEVVNDTLVNNPDVRYIFLVEPSGDIRVHTFTDGVPVDLVDANLARGATHENLQVLRTSEGPVIDIAVPVFEGQGGTIRVGMSEVGLREVVADRLTRLGLLVIGAVATAIAASFFLSSVLTRPLVRFAEAARNVGRGELTQKVPVEAADELGALARAFNAMTDALKDSRDRLVRRNEELRILNTMADHLSRSAGDEGLAQTSLERLLDLIERPAGWICLRDERGNLSLAAHSGVGRPPPQPELVQEGRCECRQVLQEGHPTVVSGAPACPLIVSSQGPSEGAEWRAVVPLFSREGTVGVLVVTDDGEPSGDRVDLLASIGQQIGAALENARLDRAIKEKEEMRGLLLQKLIVAQEEERKRVAREIHDEPAQALSGSVMRLGQMERRLRAGQGVDVTDVEAAKQAVRGAMESLSRIMLELRPSALDDLGLVPAIRWYAEQRLAEAGISLEFSASPALKRLDADVETATFRLAQEAVNNISKHSAATHARICLELRDSTLYGTIEDDGRGFDARVLAPGLRGTSALGLAGMEERARLLGGQFSIGPRTPAGTRVAFEIPLQGKATDGKGDAEGTGS